jgi:hypothetical protein
VQTQDEIHGIDGTTGRGNQLAMQGFAICSNNDKLVHGAWLKIHQTIKQQRLTEGKLKKGMRK